MKKTIAILSAVLLLAFAMAACAPNEPASGSQAPESSSPATDSPASDSPEPSAPAESPAPESAQPAPESAVPTPANLDNGTFKNISFRDGVVHFGAVVETPIYSVTLVSGDVETTANKISNTLGDLKTTGGSTLWAGSSLELPSDFLLMPEGTEVDVSFPDTVTTADRVKLQTAKDAEPMIFDFATGVFS